MILPKSHGHVPAIVFFKSLALYCMSKLNTEVLRSCSAYWRFEKRALSCISNDLTEVLRSCSGHLCFVIIGIVLHLNNFAHSAGPGRMV